MLKLMSRGNEKLCSCRAAAGLAPILACGEINGGLTGLRLLQQVADYKGEELELFCGKMREIAAWMRTLPFLSVGFVGSDRALAHLEQFTARRQAVPEAGIFRAVPQLPEELCPAVGRREYISINAKVATCTRVMAAPSRNSADYLPLLILGRMLSVGYLWDEIRAKGGAYHAHFSYSSKNSTATLLSSSDPQASATYKVFDSLRDYLNSGTFNDDEAAKAAMAHAGVFLQPQRPASYHSALALGLVNGYDNARRQEEFAHALTITPGEIREAGLRLLDPASLRFNDCAAGPAPAVEGFKTISP
jgi:Zn-dependent M16 (insulinase) family peptidase